MVVGTDLYRKKKGESIIASSKGPFPLSAHHVMRPFVISTI